MSRKENNSYLAGEKLFGDDFTYDEILRWYNEESEGYANLGSQDANNYSYVYHTINQFYGWSKIGEIFFKNALGFGSAWGFEFEPVIHRIEKLNIIEVSQKMRSQKIGNIIPDYLIPNASGKIDFEDNSFDLITCLNVLHHIPNVTFVLDELLRVLSPMGFMLIAEPVVSMGDWSKPRPGLTKHERGIPHCFFKKYFDRHSEVEIVSCKLYGVRFNVVQLILGRFFRKPIWEYKLYLIFDAILSWVFSLFYHNIPYHTTNQLAKIKPTGIYYVIRKHAK
jgi:ubiquinone/menaquinone biosynthesis C-methylase UbiE